MRVYKTEFERHGRPFTTSIEPAREHLVKLANAGIGTRAVAKLSGLSYTTIRDVRQSRRERCRVSTADAILGVALDDRVPGQRIPKKSAVALVEQLAKAGVERQEIALMLGLRTRNLMFLTKRRKAVTVRTWERLRVVATALVRDGRAPASVLREVNE